MQIIVVNGLYMKSGRIGSRTYQTDTKLIKNCEGSNKSHSKPCFIYFVVCSTNMIAIFCRYERDFKELETTPRKMFRRIRSINDIRGITFDGIIKAHDWYRGDKEITEAYDHLRVRQPELFD